MLDAHDEVADGGSGEHGIFAGVLEEAAVAGVAGEIDAAADGLVVALGAELAADDIAVEVGGVGVPGGGGAEDGGEQGGVAGLGRGHADADGGVCLLERGDAEAGDADDLAGAAVVVCGDGIAFAQRAPADAVDELDLFARVSSLTTRLARSSGERAALDQGKVGAALGWGRWAAAVRLRVQTRVAARQRRGMDTFLFESHMDSA